jgi:hypothetical protein
MQCISDTCMVKTHMCVCACAHFLASSQSVLQVRGPVLFLPRGSGMIFISRIHNTDHTEMIDDNCIITHFIVAARHNDVKVSIYSTYIVACRYHSYTGLTVTSFTKHFVKPLP